MSKSIKEHSVVLLDDGRDGTIVFVYEEGAYLVEIEDDTHKLIAVTTSQIAEVIWEP